MQFEWDVDKDLSNQAKHGVTFAQAATVFGDAYSRTVPDPDHSEQEARYLMFGASMSGRHLVVSSLSGCLISFG